jgi:hypothetical protein
LAFPESASKLKYCALPAAKMLILFARSIAIAFLRFLQYAADLNVFSEDAIPIQTNFNLDSKFSAVEPVMSFFSIA